MPFETLVVSPKRQVEAAGGVRIGVTAMRDVDVLVVPGFDADPRGIATMIETLTSEIRVIEDVGRAGTPVVSICVGAFLLGEAGLLHGRSATTSWLFARQLAERYPATQVRANELVVNDSGVTTTAAFSAMYDFGLDLIRRHCGPETARRTARIVLVDDARTSQAPYVDDDLLPASGATFATEIQCYLDQRLKEPYQLSALAAAFHVSDRTLLRRYRAETGETPLGYLQRSRMRRARHLLETTDQTLGAVHAAVGYRDAGTFSELFDRHFGMRPGAYRSAFRRQRATSP